MDHPQHSRPRQKPLALALGAAFALGGTAAQASLFQVSELASGYQVAAAADANPSAKPADPKAGEGKCGEGKCGEGQCGGAAKPADAAAKAAEHKCGEGQCGGAKPADAAKKAPEKKSQ